MFTFLIVPKNLIYMRKILSVSIFCLLLLFNLIPVSASGSFQMRADRLSESTATNDSIDELVGAVISNMPSQIESINDSIKKAEKQKKKELHRQKVAKRNFHYNILAGPSYGPDFGFLIGGSALMTFRMNPKDTTMQRSVIPIALAVLLKGGLNFSTKPQLFFRGDKFRIFGQFTYKMSEDNFYDVGFDKNKDYVRSDDTSLYHYRGMQINPWFLFRIGESNFFVGPQIDLSYDRMKDPVDPIKQLDSYKKAGGDENGYKNFSSGIGLIASYDTRDVPANPYKGLYLDLKAAMYQKWLGSNTNFYRFEFDYRQYVSVGKRKVLAWTAQTKNVFGDIPLNKYVLSGTPFDLRGYYMGQYRDKTSHLALLEYRQMFNTDKSNWFKRVILNHLGFVVWGGCGFMGQNPFKIDGVLPNAGLGIRIEVQPRMNIRLDMGRNFVNKQGLFYFNITEAF